MSFAVFGNNSKLLAAFSHPYKDEVLSSWLTRLAFNNGLSRSALLNSTNLKVGGRTDLNIDHLRNINALDDLSQYTNCSPDMIRNTSLHYYDNKLFLSKEHGIVPFIWQTVQPLSIFNSRKLRANLLYCPSCLADRDRPVYYRRKWRLSVCFVCVKCKCYLREVCPHCSKPSSQMKDAGAMRDYKTVDEYLLACGSCKKDISECRVEPAPPHIIDMQQQINNYLDQAYCATERYSVGYFRVLYGLTRMLLKNTRNMRYGSFITNIYKQTQTPDYRLDHRQVDLRDMPIKQRADVFNMASWLVEEWPDRLLGLCIKHGLNEQSMLSLVYDPPAWYVRAIEKLPQSTWKEDRAPLIVPGLSFNDPHSIEQTRKRWRYDFNDQDDYYSGDHCYIDLDDEEDQQTDLYETLYANRYPDLFHEVA